METRIFVFGSNLAGRHGKGAALFARQERGAEYGVGQGRTGQSYAIPTKGERSDGTRKLYTLPADEIAGYVVTFIRYAIEHPGLRFQVTPIGTGLAGYRHEEIAPMFAGAPENCDLPEEWAHLIRVAPASESLVTASARAPRRAAPIRRRQP